MRRTVAALVVATVLASSCSASESAAPTTASSTTTVSATSVAPSTTEAPPQAEPTTSEAPPTTIDDATLLADVEAAYLDAHEIGLESIRDPFDPKIKERIQDRYVGANLELALENLQLAFDGNFFARVNPDNPSFAVIVTPATFLDSTNRSVAVVETCEFNSDKLYQRGTAPEGADALYRDDPVSIILSVEFELVDGVWKSRAGSNGEEVHSEVEQCSNVQ